MSNRAACLIVSAIFLVGLLPALATGQSGAASGEWSAPRTPDGQPDLQGVWANNAATPLERPEVLADKSTLTEEELARLQARADELFGGDGDAAFGDAVFQAVLDDGEYQSRDGVTDDNPDGTGNYNSFWIVDRAFDNRTSLIVDPPNGRLPPLTEKALAARDEVSQGLRRFTNPAGPEDTGANVRCITYGAPYLLAGYNSYFRIVQGPTHVAILQEMIHDSRVIPLDDRPPLDDGIRQWHGDSRGHWEGDTLVVETRNYRQRGGAFAGGATASENRTVTERFTRVGPDTIRWEVTFDDPETWTAPWTAMMPLSRAGGEIFEYACHEGNYSMEGILAGARELEQAAGTEASTR